ncbi:hypothetical protein [Paenibacillus hamazuiensis]|uniref:hypothetical protein n=1 Tax=Paenibacillus hamazuiensis TaxID=2936508 RepID=UPI002010622A|nr:hypothetical protein [Paenibacillus hamazuiensis]
MDLSKGWVSGEAVVTHAGIAFRSDVYTCGLAVKERWFDKARSEGMWKVRIKYDPVETSTIHIEAEEWSERHICRPIPANMEPSYDRNQYFIHMQRLKDQRRHMKYR